jgi:uncharacterized protein YjdB
LYDFADIESYDPDNNYYLNKRANDNCDYDSNGDGSLDKNWAADWQNTHTSNVDWYNCSSAHSKPLNANRKAYAAWWLFARLAGWTGPVLTVPVSGITVSGYSGLAATITSNRGTLQLSASISPSNATIQSITWTILNNTGQASISPSGLVTAIADGTVIATASSNDGSGVYGTLTITISNQIIPVTAILVSGAGGSSVISEDNGTLQLNASVSPANATNQTVIWSISNITGTASINSAGLVTAETDGNVLVKAVAADGSGSFGTISITISNQIIPVEKIIVSTETGSTIIPEIKGTLQLDAQVSPTVATVKTVNWSVENITGLAIISPSGLVTAIDEGTVAVTATATDGTGVNGTIEIAIRNKKNDALFAIVTRREIKIPLYESYPECKISLYDLKGHLIDSKFAEESTCIFDASSVKPGIYIIVLSNSIILRVGRLIIPE